MLMFPVVSIVTGPAPVAQGRQTFGDVWLWFAVLFAVVIVLGVIVYVFRRIALSKVGRQSGDLTIEQIERLHREGTLTDEEYKRARRVILGLSDRQDGRDGGAGPV